MKRLIYSDDFNVYNKEDTFIAILEKIENEDMLLDHLYNSLYFPSYFGFNWNALSDCLRDFDWIEQKEIVIIHKELPKLDENKLKIYLEILIDACNDWKEGENHCLKIVFPSKSKKYLENIINEF